MRRTFLYLRATGEFLETRLFLRLRQCLSVLCSMWPVTAAIILMLVCFLIPGLANSQTLEAMYQYADTRGTWGSLWPRVVVTGLLASALGSVLESSAQELLGPRGPDRPSATVMLCTLVSCRWFPNIAIAIAFYRMQSTAIAGPLYAHATITLALVVIALAYKILGHLLLMVPLMEIMRRIAAQYRHLLLFAAVAVAVFFFGSAERDTWAGMAISPIAVAQMLGPVNILVLFIGTFVAFTTMLTVAGRLLCLPLVTMLVATAILVSRYDLNDNHIVRQTNDRSPEPLTVEDAFDAWMDSRPDKEHFSEYPIILVSAEGGGIRAAFFTAITLARIADRCPTMVSHIFAISGVSGGAFGAALFAAAIKAKPVDPKDQRCDMTKPARPIYEDALASVLQDDHLSPLMARMLFPDALQRILPYPINAFDRQLGLEYSIERSFRRVFDHDLMSASIYDLRPGAANYAVPYLFLNATEVQSGRRFVLSPLFLQSQPFGGAQDWHQLDWNYGPPLSAAAGVSARFPIISPAGYFFNNGRKARYVDGGYVDNSGAVTLSEIFSALYLLREEKYLADDNGNKTTKFAMTVLHIGNAPACDIVRDELAKRDGQEELQRCDPTDPAPVAGGLGELFSPFEAVIGVRSAQVEYNLDQFHNRIDLGTGLDRFDFHARVQMYDRGIPVPLGWLLSSRVAAELRSQLDARPDEPDCRKPLPGSNMCELAGTVAGASWKN